MKSKFHPLNNHFNTYMLPSQKNLSSIYARTCRFGNTFVPAAIREFNDKVANVLYIILVMLDNCINKIFLKPMIKSSQLY